MHFPCYPDDAYSNKDQFANENRTNNVNSYAVALSVRLSQYFPVGRKFDGEKRTALRLVSRATYNSVLHAAALLSRRFQVRW